MTPDSDFFPQNSKKLDYISAVNTSLVNTVLNNCCFVRVKEAIIPLIISSVPNTGVKTKYQLGIKIPLR